MDSPATGTPGMLDKHFARFIVGDAQCFAKMSERRRPSDKDLKRIHHFQNQAPRGGHDLHRCMRLQFKGSHGTAHVAKWPKDASASLWTAMPLGTGVRRRSGLHVYSTLPHSVEQKKRVCKRLVDPRTRPSDRDRTLTQRWREGPSLRVVGSEVLGG